MEIGRAGASGIALSMCDVEEREFLADIEKLIGRRLERVDDEIGDEAFAMPWPRVGDAPAG